MTACEAGTGATGLRPADARPPRHQVLLADVNPLMHLAIRSLLAPVDHYWFTGSAYSAAEAEALIGRLRPGLLLCEVSLGADNGIALCRWARQASPGTRVVMLSGQDDPVLAHSARMAGASGYLLKTSPTEDILSALDLAVSGLWASDKHLGRAPDVSGRPAIADLFELSPRECEVLNEIVLGLDNKMIAQRLYIAEGTVKSHVKAILRKLGARDRGHAIALTLGSAMTGTGRDRVCQ